MATRRLKHPLVLIEWQDSHASRGWQELDGIADAVLVCHSVGWLVHDGEQSKVLAPHVSFGSDPLQGNGVMTIPTRSVLRTVPLARRALRRATSASA